MVNNECRVSRLGFNLVVDVINLYEQTILSWIWQTMNQ